MSKLLLCKSIKKPPALKRMPALSTLGRDAATKPSSDRHDAERGTVFGVYRPDRCRLVSGIGFRRSNKDVLNTPLAAKPAGL